MLRIARIDELPPHLREGARANLEGRRTPAPALKATEPAKKRRSSRDEEHKEQVVFFNRIRTLAMNDPRYVVAVDRTYAIPNGGARSKRAAGRLKAEGVRAGVADIFCSVPVGAEHGFYLEMKSREGFPSREQRSWLTNSAHLGYRAACCRGADEAFAAWRAYVDGAPQT